MILVIVPKLDKSGPGNLQTAINKVINSDYCVYEYKSRSLSIFDSQEYRVLKNYSIFKMLTTIRNLNISLVQSQCLFADLIGVLVSWIFLTRQIIVLNNNMVDDYSIKFNYVMARILITLHCLILLNAYKIVICSNACKTNFIKRLIRKRIVKIYNITSNNLCINLLKETDNVNIFIIGSLIERKNTRHILSLVSHLKYNVHVIGDGPLREKLEGEFPQAKFYGKTNIEKFSFPVNSVLMSGSLSEGYPLAVLEFLWLGGCVVLSDIPAHQEMKVRYPNKVFLMAKNETVMRTRVLEFIDKARLDGFIGNETKKLDTAKFEETYGQLFHQAQNN